MPELIDKHAAYKALKHEADTHMLPEYKEAYEKAARIIDQMKPNELPPFEERTNGDRIRSMVDDEDLLYVIGTSCNRCAYAEGRNGEACGGHCWEGNLEWLRSEVTT